MGGQRLRPWQIAQLRLCQRGGVQRAGARRQRAVGKAGLAGLASPGAQHVDAGATEHARARGHQQRLQVRRAAAFGRLAWGAGRLGAAARQGLGALLHVADSLGGQRVAAQVGPVAVVVDARGALELFEHADEALAVEAGLHQDAVADAVGLALHVAREVQLLLDHRRLPAHGQRGAGLRVLAGGDHAGHQGRHHQRRLALFLPQQARDVALRDVRQLVRQHRGQLGARADHAHQPQVQAEVTARQRKGVDAAVAPQQHAPGVALVQLGRQLAARAGAVQQRAPQAVDVFADDGVVDVVRVAVQLADDGVAQLALFQRRHLAGVAQRGQAARGRRLLRGGRRGAQGDRQQRRQRRAGGGAAAPGCESG